MKGKFLIGAVAGAMAICLAIVSVVVFTNTEEVSAYQSSYGGVKLNKNDKNYVKIDEKNIIPIDATVAIDDVDRTLAVDGKGDNGRQVGIFYMMVLNGDYTPELFEDILKGGESETELE